MSQISQLSKLMISIALCHHHCHCQSLPPLLLQLGWCGAFFHQQVFFSLQTLSTCRHFHGKSLFLASLPPPNMQLVLAKKTWQTLFIVSPVLLGLATQFKNWYLVWRLHQHNTSEPRLTEALFHCYVILNESRDLITPAWSSIKLSSP